MSRGIVWLVIQLLPLLACLLQVPLWARTTQPSEAFALPLVLSTQLLASAILFPWLLDRSGSATFVGGTSVLFLLLATLTAQQSMIYWIVLDVPMTVWIFALSLISRRAARYSSSWCVALSSLVALGLIATTWLHYSPST